VSQPESNIMEALHAPLTDEEMIAAAQVMPGFSDDLSRWRVAINRDGGLRQEIFLAVLDRPARSA